MCICVKYNFFLHTQLEWNIPPVCFLPGSLRGAPITDLDSNALDECMEFIHDEGHDAASTSHNFLERGIQTAHIIQLENFFFCFVFISWYVSNKIIFFTSNLFEKLKKKKLFKL